MNPKITPHEAKIIEAWMQGVTIQCASERGGLWTDWHCARSINLDAYPHWRIKPVMVKRGGVELPAPLFEAPPMETRIYVPQAGNYNDFVIQYWRNSEHQRVLLRQGMVFLREHDASLHAGAMFNFEKL